MAVDKATRHLSPVERASVPRSGAPNPGPRHPGYQDRAKVGPDAATAAYRPVRAAPYHVSTVHQDGTVRHLPAASAEHAQAMAKAGPEGAHTRVHQGPPPRDVQAAQTGPRGGRYRIGPGGSKIYE